MPEGLYLVSAAGRAVLSELFAVFLVVDDDPIRQVRCKRDLEIVHPCRLVDANDTLDCSTKSARLPEVITDL